MVVVQVNPITYAVDSLRGVLIGFNQFPAYIGPIVMVGMATVFFTIALWEFRRP